MGEKIQTVGLFLIRLKSKSIFVQVFAQPEEPSGQSQFTDECYTELKPPPLLLL